MLAAIEVFATCKYRFQFEHGYIVLRLTSSLCEVCAVLTLATNLPAAAISLRIRQSAITRDTAKSCGSAATGSLCPGCGHTWRMMEHRIVAVILLRPEEMLLCHRSPARLAYPDVWDFPGGHVEPGENPLDALRREVAEELGAELDGVDGGPVLRRVDPQRSLDLTVWASRRWQCSGAC